jgi:hypothetical protein
MIKKLLLTAAIVFSGTLLLNAQCTPDITCAALVCPDTNTASGGNLPHAMAGLLYNTTMTVLVPTDTTISGFSIHVDSLNYTSITGLPTGFTITPNNSGWLGGTAGCVLISGTPADSMQGKRYNLVITTTAHGTYMSTIPVSGPLVLNGYRIIVDSSNGIGNFDMNKFSLEQNSPNPFSRSTTIFFTSKVNQTFNFSVYNVIGEIVYTKEINAVAGENRIDFLSGKLPSGIYMYKLSNKEQALTRRMIVAE